MEPSHEHRGTVMTKGGTNKHMAIVFQSSTFLAESQNSFPPSPNPHATYCRLATCCLCSCKRDIKQFALFIFMHHPRVNWYSPLTPSSPIDREAMDEDSDEDLLIGRKPSFTNRSPPFRSHLMDNDFLISFSFIGRHSNIVMHRMPQVVDRSQILKIQNPKKGGLPFECFVI